ncbi:hypothetical protein R1flu_009504 [Riccia fluitans]|uniref:Uncharacterized protein n=1 Tax=Riccia fluitans TaxID=41844 RepID=A0ABD1Z5B1_9MARC
MSSGSWRQENQSLVSLPLRSIFTSYDTTYDVSISTRLESRYYRSNAITCRKATGEARTLSLNTPCAAAAPTEAALPERRPACG